MTKQWVQHISGQGEKWEVCDDLGDHFRASRKGSCFSLPKSEYRLCDPPEVWRDITEQCVPTWDQFMCGPNSFWNVSLAMPRGNYTYRLRKVELWQANGLDGKNCPVAAFIVEQKVTE